MKFEKFLKMVGTHGEVVEVNENEKWLVCGGVGMKIPYGVDTLLGKNWNSNYASIIDVIHGAEADDLLTLRRAEIFEPSGNASAIYRIFESEIGNAIGITNADYGLIEKKDLLSYLEIDISEDELDEDIIKYMLVFGQNGELQGYITGSNRF